jgi:hypothetical protein
MDVPSRLLDALKNEQAQFAHQALQKPQEKSEWEYGYRQGIYQGITASIAILLSILADEKNGKNDI